MSRPKMNKMYCGDGFPNHPDWSDLGGGGGTYTAGDGIDITQGAISADVDGTTIGINETSKKLECLVSPGPTYTAGDGIDLVDGEIGADVDGLTIGINEDGEIECLVSPGPTYTAGDGIDITQGAISADVDGTTIGINETSKKLECLVSGGGGVDYSTTEQDTGLKWIDGKKIYQKTKYFNVINTGENSEAHNITGLSDIIRIDGIIIDKYQGIYNFYVPFYSTSSSYMKVKATKTNVILDQKGCVTSSGVNNGYVTLWYTKTS